MEKDSGGGASYEMERSQKAWKFVLTGDKKTRMIWT